MERQNNVNAVPRLPEGQHAEFEAVYKRYYAPLVGFFLNRGFSRSDSEDNAQETLMRAYRGYAAFKKDASDATWLFAIAWNIWKNCLRDNGARKRAGECASLDASRKLLLEVEASRATICEGALLGMLKDERRQLLREAIEGLPPRMRQCVFLYGSGRLSYQEIAAIVGVNVKTVKSHVSQAKARLVDALSQAHPELFGGEIR